jgi:ATP-binding cassette subfamily C protein
MIFSAFVNLLFIVPMLYMLQVYERVVPTRGSTTLAMLTLVLFVGLAVMSALDTLRSRLLIRAGVRLDRTLARTVLETTLDHPSRQARQAVREFDVLRQGLTGPAILAVLDAPWVPVYVLVAFLLHPWIGVLALVGAGLVVLLAIRNEQLSRKRLQDANQAAAQAYSEFEFTVTTSDVVRALGMRGAMVSGHLAQREAMMRLQTEASLASSGITATSKFVRQFLQSLALGLGALLAIDGLISPGAIFASMFIVGRALAPVDQVVANWRNIVQARGAWATLNELLNEAPPVITLTQLPRPSGRIEVEDLNVVTETREPILRNINFAVQPGQVVAIVGPSGAGKSTLVRALAGALTPTHGTIRFDGSDHRSWNREHLAEHVGFMPQEATLFPGTVKENIARFRSRLGEDPTQVDADAIAAAHLAGAHELIQRLAGGYDHLLGTGGRGLSAGQMQRIALARAVFRSPSVLILDEPNSNLDAEGEQELAQCIGQMKERGATVLLVAHRMSLMPIVDELMIIQDGMIAAFGPRDEILEKVAPSRPVTPAPSTRRVA